jgi:hypothetical protein
MKKIYYYTFAGKKENETELTAKEVLGCHGMKIKCVLVDGSEKVGFANTYYSFEKETIVVEKDLIPDYITLETFININEETHKFEGDIKNRYDLKREKVSIDEISDIYAILYSGLRWGGSPTNKFNLEIEK